MNMPATFQEDHLSRYESRVTTKNGKEVFIRPVLQTDGPLIIDFFNKLSPQSIYLRFLSRLRFLPEDMLYRFTHVDYQAEFALAGVIKEDGKNTIIAVCRYAYDPQYDLPELAVVVRDDWQHFGLGAILLVKIIAIAKEHGITRLGAEIDPHNNIIRKLFQDLGYEVKYTLRAGSYRLEIPI
jgi:acetyltransferase